MTARIPVLDLGSVEPEITLSLEPRGRELGRSFTGQLNSFKVESGSRVSRPFLILLSS